MNIAPQSATLPRMRNAVLALALALMPPVASALAGCTTSMSREVSYGTHLADMNLKVDGKAYSIWVHPTDDTLIVQRGLAGAMGQGMAQGLTLNAVNLQAAKPVWLAAAEQLTGPVGCKVTDIYPLDNLVTWEATFSCPPGVDLRAIIRSQLTDLRAGKPVHPG